MIASILDHPLALDILEIFIRFRVQPIALVADIEKAFLVIADNVWNYRYRS